MVSRYHPEVHHRRSIRLTGYDYAQAGAYFVTICTHDRGCLFGEIDHDEMALSAFGEIARDEWVKSSEIRGEIRLGAFVVMPDHLHGIVEIIDKGRGDDGGRDHGRGDHGEGDHGGGDEGGDNHGGGDDGGGHRGRGDRPVAPTDGAPMPRVNPTPGPKSKSIGAMVGGYKSAVTTSINALRNNPGARVWQRNYYEHVIRDEADYNRIVEYIANNPQRWAEDSLNPAAPAPVSGRWEEGASPSTRSHTTDAPPGLTQHRGTPDPTAAPTNTKPGATTVGATGRSPGSPRCEEGAPQSTRSDTTDAPPGFTQHRGTANPTADPTDPTPGATTVGATGRSPLRRRSGHGDK